MKLDRLKNGKSISLIVLVFCITLNYLNSYFNINGFINVKIQAIKDHEMEYIYGRHDNSGDKYYSGYGYYGSNVSFQNQVLNSYDSVSTSDIRNDEAVPSFVAGQSAQSDTNIKSILSASKKEGILQELREQINSDSYRNQFSYYFVFNFDYTINALQELDETISNTAKAQNMPKALISAALFREMMFLGQEDLLDGVPVIGGESIGISQIGIKNARYNDQVVHGNKSMISTKSDDEIKDMLENPEQSVYLCAVQLRARAIKITKNPNVNLNNLNADQLHKVLEEYNQSKISVTVGPIMTKAKYAEETYKYYQMFSKYYSLE